MMDKNMWFELFFLGLVAFTIRPLVDVVIDTTMYKDNIAIAIVCLFMIYRCMLNTIKCFRGARSNEIKM